MWKVNTSFGNPDMYEEEFFATKKQAVEYCKAHGLPSAAISKE